MFSFSKCKQELSPRRTVFYSHCPATSMFVIPLSRELWFLVRVTALPLYSRTPFTACKCFAPRNQPVTVRRTQHPSNKRQSRNPSQGALRSIGIHSSSLIMVLGDFPGPDYLVIALQKNAFKIFRLSFKARRRKEEKEEQRPQIGFTVRKGNLRRANLAAPSRGFTVH